MPAATLRLLALALLLLGAACGSGRGTPSDGPGGEPGPVETADQRLNTDGAGNELSLLPDLCCDGERVYVVWYDRRAGNMDIRFNRSLDGGATWLPDDVRLDSGLAGSFGSLVPRICCSGDAVYVVWYDDRSGSNDIYFNRSLDAGATWLPTDQRIDTAQAAADSREPVICCDGARVYVAWFDDRGGDDDIRFNRSLDGGTTWLASDLRIDRNSSMAHAITPRICCAGDAVYVAWSDDRSGGSSVRFIASADAGATWPATDKPLSGGSADGPPRLACSGPNVYVTWSDFTLAAAAVRFNRSLDGGTTWLAADMPVDAGLGDAREADVCADGLNVYVVWRDQRDGNADIYFNRSRDGGSTWLLSDERLDDDLAGRSTSWEPRICCDGEHLHAVWRDDRNGRFDILLTHSADRGLTWRRPEVRADADVAGAGHSIAPLVCCQGARAVVVWYDQRDGPGDIYGNRADFDVDPMDARKPER